MTDITAVERGKYLAIRTDDTEEVREPPKLEEMRRPSGAETIDMVILARASGTPV
jgi:hypothetical protein